MRLIDADELRRQILAFATGCHSEVLAVDTLMMLLIQATTINPDDCRPHGRWEWLGPYRYNNDGMIGTCSVCKERLRLFAHNYCPNCGAKMDGKENE